MSDVRSHSGGVTYAVRCQKSYTRRKCGHELYNRGKTAIEHWRAVYAPLYSEQCGVHSEHRRTRGCMLEIAHEVTSDVNCCNRVMTQLSHLPAYY